MPVELHRPTQIVASVYDIDYDQLQADGIRYLVYDLDNTLGDIGFTVFSARAREHLRERQREGFRLCFATNALRDLTGLADEFGSIVQPETRGIFGIGKQPRKPQRDFYVKVLVRLGSPHPRTAAMVGDKFMADVCGAMSVGMRGVLVNPCGADLPQERLARFRLREARQLRSLELKRPIK